MKDMRKKIIIITCILLVLIAGGVCVFFRVSKSKGKQVQEQEEDGEYKLYYVDHTNYQLVTIPYQSEQTTTYEKIKAALKDIKASSKKIHYYSAIPEKVEIQKFYISDGILYIDFNEEYYQMDKIETMLCKAAVTLTLTQIKGVDYVMFTVHEQPVTDEKGNAMTAMKAGDFVDHLGSSINAYQELEAVLYFADEKGTSLVATKGSGLYAQNTSVEKFIIEHLIQGTSDSRLRRTIPKGTKLLSVNTKDGVCYVNFDETFLEATPEISPEVQIYSVVNSLVELNHVNKVQITINGEADILFREKISLEYVLSRNLDILRVYDR